MEATFHLKLMRVTVLLVVGGYIRQITASPILLRLWIGVT